VGRVNDVVLNPQIIEQELDWKIVIRLDTAYPRRSKNHDAWVFLREKMLHGLFISQIKLRPVALRQVIEALTFEAADYSAADKTAVTGDKNFG
jgi:hypothetical protein